MKTRIELGAWAYDLWAVGDRLVVFAERCLVEVDPASGATRRVAELGRGTNVPLTPTPGGICCQVDGDLVEVALADGSRRTLLPYADMPHAGARFGMLTDAASGPMGVVFRVTRDEDALVLWTPRAGGRAEVISRAPRPLIDFRRGGRLASRGPVAWWFEAGEEGGVLICRWMEGERVLRQPSPVRDPRAIVPHGEGVVLLGDSAVHRLDGEGRVLARHDLPAASPAIGPAVVHDGALVWVRKGAVEAGATDTVHRRALGSGADEILTTSRPDGAIHSLAVCAGRLFLVETATPRTPSARVPPALLRTA